MDKWAEAASFDTRPSSSASRLLPQDKAVLMNFFTEPTLLFQGMGRDYRVVHADKNPSFPRTSRTRIAIASGA